MVQAKHTVEGTPPRRALGISASTVLLLAALAAIRVPLHDLGIVEEGSAAAWLLVLVPLTAWVAVVLRRRVPNPFLTLLVVGVVYGLMLAVGHQSMWGAAYGGSLPTLGGNLDGVLVPGQEAVVFRVSAFFSSVFTGTLVGAVTGTVAGAIRHARRA